jgi:hypothetical protein
LDIDQGIPYLSWSEQNTSSNVFHVFVRHWDGQAWVADGGALNTNPAWDAMHPNLAVRSGIPYLAFGEGASFPYELFVKHFSGGQWVTDGANMNYDPASSAFPDIAFSSNAVTVAWSEDDYPLSQVYVAHSPWIAPSTATPTVTATPANATVTPVAPLGTEPRVYPNPWRASQAVPVTFDNLPLESTVRLFAVSGRLVRTFHAASSSIIWDPSSEPETQIGQGMYLYLIEDSHGNRWKGKLAILR